jgi:hypothetical protein
MEKKIILGLTLDETIEYTRLCTMSTSDLVAQNLDCVYLSLVHKVSTACKETLDETLRREHEW